MNKNDLYQLHFNNTDHVQAVCDLFNSLSVSRKKNFVEESHIENFRKYGGFFDYFTLDEIEKYTKDNRHMITVTSGNQVYGALLISGNQTDIRTYFVDKNIAIKNRIDKTSYGCIIGVKSKRNLIAKMMLNHAFEFFISEGYIDFLIEVISVKSYEEDGVLKLLNVRNEASTQVSKWLDGAHIGKVFYKQYNFDDIIINTEYDLYSIDIKHCIDHIL